MNFIQSTSDPCLYKNGKEKNAIYIIVYVDDILISGSEKQIKEFIKELTKHYEVKDLGEISYYLGIKISRNEKGDFYLNQK